MTRWRTQVGIIGAGPAGLLLSQLLHIGGIESVVLECRDRTYVAGRIRAGVLEQGTVDLLREACVAERLDKLGLVHDGIEIAFAGRRHPIRFSELIPGKSVTIYGQTEVVKDLIAARLAAGGDLRFEAENVVIHEADGDRPRLTCERAGAAEEIDCDFIAGCDGFHGVARESMPRGHLQRYERLYPFAWLGILAEAPPAGDRLIYARHERGFALCSMRSPVRSRHYLQCRPEEDLAAWSEDRIWSELRLRTGADLSSGPLLEKSITPMRSFVIEPMRFGRLFLAGDAAHIVPPTGAKGLNLAASDVHYLAEALVRYYESRDMAGLDAYSQTALARVWKAQRFSWWMTSMLHVVGESQPFEDRIRQAELEYVLSSRAALRSLAENYVGLPF
jgi:p-hydroxybenzoate 3-monooxygenase